MSDSQRPEKTSAYSYRLLAGSFGPGPKRQCSSSAPSQQLVATVSCQVSARRLTPTDSTVHQPLLPPSQGYWRHPEDISLTLGTAATVSSQQRDVLQAFEPDIKPAKKSYTEWRQTRQTFDGNSRVAQSVTNDKPSVTLRNIANMAGKQYERLGQPLSSRPVLVSHHSNSVPSTPVQLARDFQYRSRSPSPHNGLGSHSPRSVSSEANGVLPSLRPRGGCRFETSAAFGRRRIPYDIGTEMLEREGEDPKAALEPAEERKLSDDMRELYDRLLPSPESDVRRRKFVKKLERILREEWPGTDFQVHVFGSSGNMLCTSDSDGGFHMAILPTMDADAHCQSTFAFKRR